MKTSIFVLMSSLLVLGGCATHKTMVPISGSKSDGIVKMAYEYSLYESPVVNQEASRAQAAKRCQAWGYSDAEAFGTATKQCLVNSGLGCEKFRVITEYQCTGSHSVQPNVMYQNSVGQPTQQIIINIPAPAQQTQTLQPINRY